MTKFDARNERVKRAYVRFLRGADRKAEATVRGIEKALLRYETHTGFADFASFNADQAIAFKKGLAAQDLSQATIMCPAPAARPVRPRCSTPARRGGALNVRGARRP